MRHQHKNRSKDFQSSAQITSYNSTHKIQQLYEQFQTLKKRIVISQRKRQRSLNQQKQSLKNNYLQKETLEAYKSPRQFKHMPASKKHNNYSTSIHDNYQKQSSYLDLQAKNILKSQVIKFFNDSVFQIQKKYRLRMAKLQQRLICINQILPQLGKIMKLTLKQRMSQQKQLNINKRIYLGNCSCDGKQKSEMLINTMQIQQRYNEKMKKLTDIYQGKIGVLMNQIKDMATTSSTQKDHISSQKKSEYQIRNLQQKLFDKQAQLNKQQIQSSKLRQQILKVQRNLKDKQVLLNQLKVEVSDKNFEIEIYLKQIEQLNKKIIIFQKIEKDFKAFKSSNLSLENIKKRQNQSSQKLLQAQNKILTLQQEKLFVDLQLSKSQQKYKKLQKKLATMLSQNTKKQQEIRDLIKKQTKIKVMQKTINSLALDNQNLRKQLQQFIGNKAKPFGKSMKKDSQQIKILNQFEKQKQQNNIQNNSKIRKPSSNQQIPSTLSLNERDHASLKQIYKQHNNNNNDDDNFYQDGMIPLHKNDYLRHSHLILPYQQRQIQKQMKIKQLQSQLHLIFQQNKLLKLKKDRFEQQVKVNQNDQQKFQIQSDILRQEIKRLHLSVRILDECALNLLLKKELSKQKIEKLYNNDKDLKFPEEYKKTILTSQTIHNNKQKIAKK